MKFHECVSHIYLKEDSVHFENEAWWFYIWRKLELLNEEDYWHVKYSLDEIYID